MAAPRTTVARADMAGVVRHVDGRPAAGALVDAAALVEDMLPVASTRSAADGSYRLERLPWGSHWILARLETERGLLQGVALAPEGQRHVDVTLDRHAEILDVVVRDPEGRLVPFARLSARLEGRTYDLGVVRDGRARVPVGTTPFDRGLPRSRGAWLEAFDARAANAGAALPLTPAEVGPLPERVGPVEIRLAPGGLVRAEIVAPREIDLTRLAFRLALLDDEAPAAPGDARRRPPHAARRVEGTLPADGAYQAAALDLRRTHVLEIQTDPTQILPLPPQRLVPDAAPARIVLRPAVAAQVLVLDPQGEPVESGVVTVQPDGRTPPEPGRRSEGEISGRTGLDGTATLEGLDPDVRYLLRAEPPPARWEVFPRAPSGGRDWLPAALTDWAPGPTTVRLRQGYAIAGRVFDADGQLTPGVELLLDGRQERTVSAADGTFRFGPLEAGTYVVRASMLAGHPALPRSEALEVRAGRGEVLVRLPAMRTLKIPLPPRRGTFTLRCHDGSAWAPVVSPFALQVADDVLVVRGLVREATYEVLCITGEPDYLRAAIDPGSDETAFVSVPGGVIHGRVEGAPRGASVSLHWGSPVGAGVFELDADGRFSIPGLPDGEYDVGAFVHGTYGSYEAPSVRARPGEVLRLRLERVVAGGRRPR